MADDLAPLVPALVRHDSAAFQELVARTQLDVWRLCAYLVDQDCADDLTQETFLRAYRGITGLREESGIRAWLLTIARRVCAAEIDRRVRARDLSLRVRPLTDVHGDHSGATDLRLLLGQLPVERRTAFVLTQVIGCDYAEAAAICGVPVGTIRSRIARARDDLAAALAIDVRADTSIGHN